MTIKIKNILYISDGIEQYCNNSIEVCSLAKNIRDSQITIYAIGKRDPYGNLSCIADSKNSFDLNQVSFEYALKEIANNILKVNNSMLYNIYASDPIKSEQKEALISINSISDRFGLKAEVNNLTITQLATNVTVSKTMKEGDRGPKIEIKISTPKPRYMDKDFLFSIDSSGSVGLEGYNSEINNSMRKVLAYLNNRDKGEHINISILSWDGDVDFAYGNLNNGNNTTRARFISVKQTEKDFPSLMGNFTCIETEPTIFNVGLNEAFKILKNDPNKKYPNNIRALFFITGKGEFQPWTPDENFDDKIPRFALGVGVEDTSLMNDSLFNISSLGEVGYRRYSAGTVEYSFPSFIKELLGGDSKDLGDHMIELLDIAINSSILYNLSISDNINPFLEIDPDSIRVNDRRDGFRKFITNTNITIELNKTLNPGSEVKITYDARVNLTLPLSEKLNETIISQKFLGKGESGTLVEYNWQDGNRYEVKMPTNHIHIFS